MTEWTHELEALLLEALQGEWRALNAALFRGGMLPPVLVLEDTQGRLGQWRRAERAVAISLPLAREKPWHVVRGVLKHEMAHQYVDEVLGVLDETAHGPAFAEVCRQRGIDARAAGVPVDDDDGGTGAVGDDAARVMRRVQKLLALAASDNPHEADAAANAAQRLMLEHNVVALERAGARAYHRRRIGAPRFRLQAHEKMLAGLLARHYFVEVVIARAYVPDAGREAFVVELSGTAENLAMAEWVYAFLVGAGERAFAEHERLRGADRRRFLVGFVSGVSDKLRKESEARQEQGLVWLGDADLRAFVRREHPRLAATRVSAVVDAAHHLGRAAGRDVVIARPVEAAAAARGLALRGRR